MVDVGRTKARRDGEDGGFGARKGWSTGSGDIDPVAGGEKGVESLYKRWVPVEEL